MSLSTEIPKIMVFRPTLEEMKDFAGYIRYMESKGAHKAGLAKVIPPKEFIPRKDYSTVDLVIPAPIQQEVMGHKGLFTQFNIQKKPLTFAEYKKIALSDKFKTPDHFDYDDLERKYWRNLAYNSPIYGADVSGTIYDKDWDIWNINRLQTVLDVIEEEQGVKIEGVNTAYLYFGMWKTTFAWHTEDMDLYSINYIHFGAPKTWYAIPPMHGKRLERLAAGFYPQNFQICPNFLRHKMTVISPQILKKYSIPYNKITHECGEFMITFPYGYHSGFNHGFNCAESTNFASVRWIDHGKRAMCCTCARDTVKINIDPFVRMFQPDRYEAWKRGEDFSYIEEIDGPMTDAQLLARRDRKPHKKDSALLKRKIEEVPTKPRRHPVHKRDGREAESESTKLSKVHKKRGRMSTMVFKNVREALERSSVASEDSDIVEVEIDIDSSGAESTDTLSVKEVLYKKIKDKSKSKIAPVEIKTELLDTKAEVTLKKSEAASKKPEEAFKMSEQASQKSEQASKKSEQPSKKSEQASKSHVVTELQVKIEPSSQKSLPPTKPQERKPVKLRTKRGLEELRIKEELKKKSKEECKSQGKVRRNEGVHTEHAYSSSPSNDLLSNIGTTVAQAESQSATAEEKTSNTHHTSSKKSNEAVSRKKKKKSKKSKHHHEKNKIKHSHERSKKTKVRVSTDFTTQEYALMKTWARSMFGLWVTQPNSFEMEQAYNASLADQKPGCCVCMLFYNDKVDMPLSQATSSQSAWDSNGKIDSQDWSTGDRAFSSSMSKVAGTQEDRRMVVLTPEYCFAASSENPNPTCANSLLSPDGRSPILTCSQCMIAVHASCYGEENILESGEWKCTRCKEGDFLAECCLCNLRGGALKLTSDDNWAHIVCAMAIPEVTFEDVEAREPINIDRISPARLKLKCFFCRSFIKHSPTKNGACIQCSVGKCALAFHVTCAHAAGVIMDPSDWPFSVYTTCLRHPFPNRDLPRERPLRKLEVGEKVVAKYKNNRYYKSVINGERDQLFYHVLFDDGTFSDNLFAQDIENHDCVGYGDPPKGTAVVVRWTDNELYNGKFVKSYYVKLYDVEFENEVVVTVKREDVYAKEEPLPKKVKTRFSHASNMQHEGFLENKVVPEKYRHLPCRDSHLALSQTEYQACCRSNGNPATQNLLLSESSQQQRSVEAEQSGLHYRESGYSLTVVKSEPAYISQVKSEPVSLVRVKSDTTISQVQDCLPQGTPTKVKTPVSSPIQIKSSPISPRSEGNSQSRLSFGPVQVSPGSAFVHSPVKIKSEHFSPRSEESSFTHSPVRSARVSPREQGTTGRSYFLSSPIRHNLNGTASQQNTAMSASEAAALATLASMSSQSPYLSSSQYTHDQR